MPTAYLKQLHTYARMHAQTYTQTHTHHDTHTQSEGRSSCLVMCGYENVSFKLFLEDEDGK